MAWQKFRAADLPATPWKNGGGSTREIVCWPFGAGLNDFDWRASIATIASAGPFSVFPGIDRSITLLDGDGVRLMDKASGVDHRLDVRGEPFAFSGDARIDCELLGATSSDFNIMVRRGRLKADVRRLIAKTDLPPSPHGVLLSLQGTWSVEGHGALSEGEGLWWTDEPLAWRLVPQSAQAGLLAACIRSAEPN